MCRCLWSEDIFDVCGDTSMQTSMGEEGDVLSAEWLLQVQSSGGTPRCLSGLHFLVILLNMVYQHNSRAHNSHYFCHCQPAIE